MAEYFQLLRRYNQWDGQTFDTGYLRADYCERIVRYAGNRLVKVLTGQRRSGKSFILRQIAGRLMASGVAPRNIFMLNFDISAFDFVTDHHALEQLFRLYLDELKPQGRVFLLIDEIQKVEGWERFVNSYSQDYTRDYELFITGSNSKMLSGELATLLSGRYVKFEILPFSYDEYAGISQQPIGRASYVDYLRTGGMPELFHLHGDEMRRNYVSSLKDTIMLRDIVKRYQVKDPRLLDELFVYLVNNVSTLFSVNSLQKYYKGRGRTTSYEKIALYLDHLSEAYLVHRVERYNIKGKEIISGQCKYYANDLAFRNYLYRGMAHGVGYELENLVYLELRRAGFDVYVGDVKGREVDFVATKNDRTVYVQCTYMLTDEATIQREYASLEAIDDHYEKLVVSLDDVTLPSRKGIRHVCAWNLKSVLATPAG